MARKKTAIVIVTGLAVLIGAGIFLCIHFQRQLGHEMLLAHGRMMIAKGIAKPVDLSDTYKPNSAFSRPVPFYPWTTCPRGFQVLRNVPLNIDGIFYLWGGGNAAQREVFPEEVLGIDINSKFEMLYIYGNTFYNAPVGNSVYTVVFNYADGSSETNDVCYGDDVLGWSTSVNQTNVQPTSRNAKLAWVGGSISPSNKKEVLRFCLTAIPNPHPFAEVLTIDMYSSKTRAAGAIFAMTTGKAGLMK